MPYRITLLLALALLTACQGEVPAERDQNTVTLLFTNDVESAYDPIPAFWLEDQEMIGGIAEMTTLINDIRATQPNVFLFDSGDIFTGALAKLTEGRLAFELMITMGYDAMAIGNHEFEYGHEIFAWQKNRAPFPVLGANFFYRDTDHPYAQAHAVIERGGIRIGVIGIMGQDAVSAIIPSFIAPLDVTVPAEAVQRSVDELRDAGWHVGVLSGDHPGVVAALADPEFDGFDRGAPRIADVTCMMEYEKRLPLPFAFIPEAPAVTLNRILSDSGIKQFHCSETEKYAHVTFFLNGGEEEPFPGEDRILVPSPTVATYDLQPAMSAPEP